MSIYKDHFDKRLADAAAAEQKLTADAAKAAEQRSANLALGKAWLESIAVPELNDAKSGLISDLTIDFTESVALRRSDEGIFHEIRFTMNPKRYSGNRSFTFVVCADEGGKIWTECRKPADDNEPERLIRKDKLSGPASALGSTHFQAYLKQRIDDAMKL